MVCTQLLASRRSTLRRGNATAQPPQLLAAHLATVERIARASHYGMASRLGYDRPVLSDIRRKPNMRKTSHGSTAISLAPNLNRIRCGCEPDAPSSRR